MKGYTNKPGNFLVLGGSVGWRECKGEERTNTCSQTDTHTPTPPLSPLEQARFQISRISPNPPLGAC